LSSTDIEIEWRQFPLRLAYATTVHRAKDQILKKIVVELCQPVFAHALKLTSDSEPTYGKSVNKLRLFAEFKSSKGNAH
ncbi:hypothetical protein BB560_006267, partial [Smittium megazygosporum]